MRTFLASILSATLLASLPAYAQDLPGDVSAGHEFARDVCSECHYVEREWADLYVYEAPSFVEIARNSDHSELSLRVFLKTPHVTMPNLILTEDQTSDVISWILSLREE